VNQAGTRALSRGGRDAPSAAARGDELVGLPFAAWARARVPALLPSGERRGTTSSSGPERLPTMWTTHVGLA
jgi:hypothetical protein